MRVQPGAHDRLRPVREVKDEDSLVKVKCILRVITEKVNDERSGVRWYGTIYLTRLME